MFEVASFSQYRIWNLSKSLIHGIKREVFFRTSAIAICYFLPIENITKLNVTPLQLKSLSGPHFWILIGGEKIIIGSTDPVNKIVLVMTLASFFSTFTADNIFLLDLKKKCVSDQTEV